MKKKYYFIIVFIILLIVGLIILFNTKNINKSNTSDNSKNDTTSANNVEKPTWDNTDDHNLKSKFGLNDDFTFKHTAIYNDKYIVYYTYKGSIDVDITLTKSNLVKGFGFFSYSENLKEYNNQFSDLLNYLLSKDILSLTTAEINFVNKYAFYFGDDAMPVYNTETGLSIVVSNGNTIYSLHITKDL